MVGEGNNLATWDPEVICFVLFPVAEVKLQLAVFHPITVD